MPDVTCKRCAEPWDLTHVRNEAFGGDRYDGRDQMPEGIAVLYDAWIATDPWSGTPAEREARDALGLAYYNTGLAHGCTSCWDDPSNVLPEDARLEVLQRAILFDDAWDGDPAELIGSLF